MDEPSSGLDPASRKRLWNVLKSAKKDRAIILTSIVSLSLVFEALINYFACHLCLSASLFIRFQFHNNMKLFSLSLSLHQ